MDDGDVIRDLEAAIASRQNEREARRKLQEIVLHLCRRISLAAQEASLSVSTDCAISGYQNGRIALRALPDGRVDVASVSAEGRPVVLLPIISVGPQGERQVEKKIPRQFLVGVSSAIPALASMMKGHAQRILDDTERALEDVNLQQ